MRKLFLVALAGCCTQAALASETRLNTLRQPIGVRDETQTFLFPAMVNEYSLALIELGTKGFGQVYGGAMTNVGSGSAGIIVSREEALLSASGNTTLSLIDEFLSKSASNDAGNSGQAILPEPERPVEFLYGMGGKDKGWGLRLVTATYKNKTKDDAADTKSEKEAQQLDLYLGYSMFGQGRLDVGLGIGVIGNLKSKTSAATDSEYEYNRGIELTLMGRKFIRKGKGRAFFGGALRTRSLKIEVDVGGTEEDKSFDEKLVLLEGGYVALPAEGVIVNLAAQIGVMDSKGPIINNGTGIGSGGGPATPSILTEEKTVKRSSNWIETSIGVEAPVYGSLGILGGMSYAVFGSLKETDDIADTKTEESIPQTADSVLWSLGLFVEEGALRADASYSKSFLHDGPHFVSGNTTTPLLAQISMTYKI